MFTMTCRGFLGSLVVLALVGPVAGLPTAAAEDAGLAAFTGQKCNMCHSVPQAEIVSKVKSEKMKGPDLPSEVREAEWIMGYISRQHQLNGKDHKKEFKGTDEELQVVAAWLVQLQASQ